MNVFDMRRTKKRLRWLGQAVRLRRWTAGQPGRLSYEKLPATASRLRTIIRHAMLATVTGWFVARGAEAHAQNSSLHGAAGERKPLTLANSSWLYIKPEDPPEIQLNDIITVIVDQKSQYINNTMLMRRQRTNMDANLEKWLKFKHFGLGAAPMTGGSPEVEALYNLQNQVQANLRQADGLQFRVGATVVDIRPNGNLVIEAHGRARFDNEVTEQSLSGIIRRQDVLPNNTVLSEDVAELQLYVRQEGHIRDSWRRGWLWLFLDRHKPF